MSDSSKGPTATPPTAKEPGDKMQQAHRAIEQAHAGHDAAHNQFGQHSGPATPQDFRKG